MSDHPDLEALSASLDGEGEGIHVDVHVRGCQACQARLSELASVREEVGRLAHTPPPPAARDEAIAWALAVADEWQAAAGDRATGSGDVAPAAAWPPARSAESGAEGGGRRSGFRWWLTGSAAAAVVAIVVAVAALVGGLGGSGGESDTALSSGPPGTDTAQESSGQAPAGPSSDGVVDAGDLGEIGDVATLRSRVASAARAGGTASPAAGAAGATGSPGEAVSPGPASAVPPTPRVVGTRVCEVEARTARPQLGVVVFAAPLRFQGTPAVALGFAEAPGRPPVTLLVLAPGESCRLLAESTVP